MLSDCKPDRTKALLQRAAGVSVLILVVSACTPSAPSETPQSAAAPLASEGNSQPVAAARSTSGEQSLDTRPTQNAASFYWGVEEGEALTLRWEELMPEGSAEELEREQAAFYAMLEKRYAANTTTLFDAADPYAPPFSEIEEGSELDFMPQFGNFETVDDLNGQLIKLPGYVVPFEPAANNRYQEFLFVPQPGACIHFPPPPPNQIILVRTDKPVRVPDIWAPYWLEGTLMIEKNENDLGNTAYGMTSGTLDPFPMLD
ncbi:MAG: DUF3299 domain-containing protein [Pseudomonadota bacterium]